MHGTGSSYPWFIFNLNTKYCYSQITCYGTYIRCTLKHLHVNPAPYFPLPHPLFYSTNPFYITTFYLLWKPAFLARGANTHPLLSLVCFQLFTPYCFTHPETAHRSSYSIYIDDINNSAVPSDTLSQAPKARSCPAYFQNRVLFSTK
jgi:hypothetical protein